MAEDIIDLNEFLERVQDDKELLLELLDIFIEDYQIKRQQLSEAIAKNDFEQLKSLAHSLKGASGNISAKTMRLSFLDIEEKGKNSDLGGVEETLSNIDAQFEVLKKRINELKEELK